MGLLPTSSPKPWLGASKAISAPWRKRPAGPSWRHWSCSWDRTRSWRRSCNNWRDALDPAAAPALRSQLLQHPSRQPLQQQVEQLLRHVSRPEIASWFIMDARGVHLAAAFDAPAEASPVGGNFSYRTYYHGGPTDLRVTGRRPIERTHLSTVFQSTATGTWKVAISTPLKQGDTFVGIVALTVELGRLGELLGGVASDRQFNVLVDGRAGDSRGVILQHPLFIRLLAEQGRLNADFSIAPEYRVALDGWDEKRLYEDPLGRHPQGQAYRRHWIAAQRRVLLGRGDATAGDRNTPPLDTGLVVIVQEDYDLAAAPVYSLARSLVRQGLLAFAVVMLVVGVLWYFVTRA